VISSGESKGLTALGFVFLSYSTADRSDARRLVDALRDRGVDVWWDVDRRHEVNEWGPDIDSRLHAADRILALVTPHVTESPRDFVFAEMLFGREKLKLVALQIGDMQLPYKYQSIMLGLNRRAYQNFDQILQPEALDDICGACGGNTGPPTLPPTEISHSLTSEVSVERMALAIATATLEGLPIATVVAAAAKLELRLRGNADKEEDPTPTLLRARSARLREIGAEKFELMHPRLEVSVHCVRFVDPAQRFKLLEYAWDELDDLRESLLTWLDGLAASPSPDVRASIGLVIGVLARSRFASALDQVLGRWITDSDPALRDVADLALRVAVDEPGVERAVGIQIQDWARGDALPQLRAAIELACGYTGSRLPDLAIETLKTVAKTNIFGVDAVSIMHDAIDYLVSANREAADGSLFDLSKLLKGLCGWANETLPQKGHKMLPLILFFQLIGRLPLRSPKDVPGVLSIQAILDDQEMTQAVARIFDVALRAAGREVEARELARDCLKKLCRRANDLIKSGRLPNDPVLRLAQEIYRVSPTPRDRERLIYTVARTYPRTDVEAGFSRSRLTDERPENVSSR
jgi:hypothetical protein